MDGGSSLQGHKPFPVFNPRQGFGWDQGTIPWRLVERHRETAERNHGHKLEVLARRGGVSWVEMWLILHDQPVWPVPQMSEDRAKERVLEMVQRMKAAEADGFEPASDTTELGPVSAPAVHVRPRATLGRPVPLEDPQTDFGGALAWLRAGRRVAREGWNGKGMWLRLFDPFGDPEFLIQERGPAISGTLAPWIGLHTADNHFVPWLASQTDVLAVDWRVLPETGGAS